jgi:hypothetical protein
MPMTGGTVVTSNLDLDVAKDRLVDSLSTAKDVTVTAVKADIAPAVVAAVGAAREASGPAYAEAASRASDAAKALRGSEAAARASDAAKSLLATEAGARATDAAKAVRGSDVAKSVMASGAVNKALRRDKHTGRKRWTLVAACAAAGVAVATVTRRRRAQSGPAANAYPAPTDAQSSMPKPPVADPAADTPTVG